jgi:hypothetical protein
MRGGQPTLMGMTLNEGDSITPYWDPVKGVDRDIADSITMQNHACNIALEAGYAEARDLCTVSY